jgi:hypothetical protein
MDLGFVGPKFTWTNRQDADHHVKVRLDRAVANGDFMQMFDGCSVENLITTSSDHYAVQIKLERGVIGNRSHVMSHSFKYEAMWRRAPDYKEVLERAWSAGSEGPSSLRSTWMNINRMASTLKD